MIASDSMQVFPACASAGSLAGSGLVFRISYRAMADVSKWIRIVVVRHAA
jgi:hypothetical protein